MDEITIGDKTYISSKRAAKITGYAKDYVGQLCREGRVEARLVGRNWYVLDSAIQEHRFGKADEEIPAAPGPLEPTPEAPVGVSAWEKPLYEAETPVLVPTLESRSVPVHAVAPEDMQSAWRQWFEEKPQKALPDGEEDFTEELLPAVIPMESEEEVEEEPVLISRIAEREVEEEILGIADEPEERVELHRSYASRETGETMPDSSSMVVDLSEAETPKRTRKVTVHRTSSGLGSAVIRALLLVIALIAVLAAVIGTGSAEKFISGTSIDFGAQKNIIEYLGGTSSYKRDI